MHPVRVVLHLLHLLHWMQAIQEIKALESLAWPLWSRETGNDWILVNRFSLGEN